MHPDDIRDDEAPPASGIPATRPSLLLSLIQQEIAALDAERLAMQAETNALTRTSNRLYRQRQALAAYLMLLREEKD